MVVLLLLAANQSKDIFQSLTACLYLATEMTMQRRVENDPQCIEPTKSQLGVFVT